MNEKLKLKRCRRCALPDTYPGIHFNEDGICNYCIYFDAIEERENILRVRLRKKAVQVIKKVKKERHKYHCIVAYSGGKDSTFLLQFLKKEFHLNILAHVLDNGFISLAALENIRGVTKILNIHYDITRPPFELLKKIFRYALTQRTSYPKEILAMMSPVCVVCQGMVFGSTIKLAMRLKIPLMFIGYTLGQYPSISLENFSKVKSNVFLSSRVYKDDPLDIIKIVRDPLDEKFGEEIEDYYFKSQYIGIVEEKTVPRVLFPFHFLLDYEEERFLREISKLGWKKPEDTDPCSTNCLLNTLGNYACVNQLGYHPYIGELSALVRKGKMSYQKAIESEKLEEDTYAMHYTLKKLNLKKEEILKVK